MPQVEIYVELRQDQLEAWETAKEWAEEIKDHEDVWAVHLDQELHSDWYPELEEDDGS